MFKNFHNKIFIKISLKQFLAFGLFCFAINNNAFATTLGEAIEEAKESNRNIKLEQIKVNSAKTLKREAISEFLPSVKAAATYGQRRSHFFGQTTDRSLRQNTRQITVEQPIFDGFHSVSKYKEAKHKIKSARSKTSDKVQEISFETAKAYANLFRYQKISTLQEENKILTERFLNLAKRRKYARIIDKAEIIKFQYEASVNEEKYLDALTKLNKAKIDYINIVGAYHNDLKEPKIIDESFSKQEIIDSALQGNKNIESYRNNYLASKYAYNAERSNLSPKVYLTGNIEKQESVIYLDNRDLSNRSLFLNLSVPIFNKGIEYANIAKARYEKQAALEEYEISKDETIREASTAFEEYKFYKEINKANKKLFEMSEQRSRIFNKRYKAKVEDPIEVIRVKIESNERNINYINSKMDLVSAYYKIKYLLGQI